MARLLAAGGEMICEGGHGVTVPDRQNTVKSVFDYLSLERKTAPSHPFAIMANSAQQAPPNRITELREQRGMTIEQLAEKSGISVSYLWRIAHGERNLSVKNLNKIAAALEVNPNRVLEQPAVVPIVGYVGAGAEMHNYAFADSPDEFVPMPEGGNENTVAVEVRGSSLGSIFDTWLVYYDRVQQAPTSDMLGKLCVVGLPDDRVLVKRLRRGSTPGRYNLESNTEGLIEDAEIIWAAKVRNMTPR